jgi:5-methylcytosine-specific restriction protein A
MTSYLICWKPATENTAKGWPEEKLVALFDGLQKSGTAQEPWRFSRRKGVAVGERVFLLRQGRRGQAILGYGRVAALPKENDDQTTVSFELLVNPRSKSVLATQQELQSIVAGPGVWNTQASGIALTEEVASQLEKLVVGRSPIPDISPVSAAANPDWSRDELILALDLYFRVPAARGSKTHPECIKLSQVLNALPIHRAQEHGETFRNANGVGMKLSNFLKYDPAYTGVGLTAGSHLEEEVWTTFSGDHAQLRKAAEAIVVGAKELSDEGIAVSDEEGDDEAEEGRILTAIHKRRERQPALVKKKKNQVFTKAGALKCEVCGFDFAVRYGEIGQGFAECHHGRAVCDLKPGDKTKLSELHIVCANCHRMLHRERPWLSVPELKAIHADNL